MLRCLEFWSLCRPLPPSSSSFTCLFLHFPIFQSFWLLLSNSPLEFQLTIFLRLFLLFLLLLSFILLFLTILFLLVLLFFLSSSSSDSTHNIIYFPFHPPSLVTNVRQDTRKREIKRDRDRQSQTETKRRRETEPTVKKKKKKINQGKAGKVKKEGKGKGKDRDREGKGRTVRCDPHLFYCHPPP